MAFRGAHPSGAPMGWWRALDPSVVDPITLEPIRGLKHEPFRLLERPNHYFDAHVLASYLISTSSFRHPLTNEPLPRTEVVRLERHCGASAGCRVVEAFDLLELYAGQRKSLSPEKQKEIASLFKQLFDFARYKERGRRGPPRARPARPAAPPPPWDPSVANKASPVVHDEDEERFSGKTSGGGDSVLAGPSFDEAFPDLASALAPGAAGTMARLSKPATRGGRELGRGSRREDEAAAPPSVAEYQVVSFEDATASLDENKTTQEEEEVVVVVSSAPQLLRTRGEGGAGKRSKRAAPVVLAAPVVVDTPDPSSRSEELETAAAQRDWSRFALRLVLGLGGSLALVGALLVVFYM